MTSPLLSIIVPCKTRTDPQLQSFLRSVSRQDFPKDQLEVLIMMEGNSEQAKAYGIQKSRGEILGFFCADNEMRDTNFLSSMVWYARQPGMTGAYTCQYDHVGSDKPLSRYFALFGANDPLCWWLGKADREDYSYWPVFGVSQFTNKIPSIGDNGFFVKRSALDKISINPDTHFPMDLCEDLRQAGESTYWITPLKLWHRSGESFFDYFRRRYVYTRDLYFKQQAKRRWHMVDRGDGLRVLGFCLASVLVVPHLWTSIRGFAKVKDPAWFLHPLVCGLLTLLYGLCYLKWGLLFAPLSSARISGQPLSNAVLKV